MLNLGPCTNAGWWFALCKVGSTVVGGLVGSVPVLTWPNAGSVIAADRLPFANRSLMTHVRVGRCRRSLAEQQFSAKDAGVGRVRVPLRHQPLAHQVCGDDHEPLGGLVDPSMPNLSYSAAGRLRSALSRAARSLPAWVRMRRSAAGRAWFHVNRS